MCFHRRSCRIVGASLFVCIYLQKIIARTDRIGYDNGVDFLGKESFL